MLIRFVVNNMLSFGKEKEFNTLPLSKYSRMNEHKYSINDISVLKMSSIYGANGAGKSNIVKLLQLLKEIIIKEQFPANFDKMKFRLGSNNNKSQVLAIEFFQDGITFSYAIEVLNNIILKEELYKTSTIKEKDENIFERTTLDNGSIIIKFYEDFYSNDENKVLKNVIEKNLAKPNKPVFKLLTTLNNPSLKDVTVAFKWFINSLIIIHPNSKPVAIAHKIDIDSNFNQYAKEIMYSFNVGEEESDGTIRLLDFIPAFKDMVSEKKVYVIDEIERSIHPLLIKELINKFSNDDKTNGQLIFTTHESNLLDQEIFRQDEIWFVEKDKNGCSDIYSLSDFKNHHTIDIRKGYLTGRYGSIPFLANLQDLNWHKYDSDK